MKKTFFIILSLFAMNCFAAVNLECEQPFGEDGNGLAFALIEGTHFDCKIMGQRNNVEYYHLFFMGVGAGVRIDVSEKMILSCPLVKKKHLEGNYYGVKITAGAIVGGDAAVLTNKRLGTCLLGGIGFMQGASAMIGQMVIEKD